MGPALHIAFSLSHGSHVLVAFEFACCLLNCELVAPTFGGSVPRLS